MKKKTEELLKDIGDVKDKYIDEADCQIAQPQKNRIKTRIFSAVAVCAASICIVAALGRKTNETPQKNDKIVVTNGFETSVTADSQHESVSDTIGHSDVIFTAANESEDTVTNVQTSENVSESTPKKEISIYGTGVEKPSDYATATKYSYLDIDNNRAYTYYTVQDGYYNICFLKDKTLEAQINSEIKALMDEISKQYDPGYLNEKDGDFYKSGWAGFYGISRSVPGPNELSDAAGIAMEIICHNGYLSVALGYLDSDGVGNITELMKEERQKYERRFDVVRTLNYDLINKKKINDISELFYAGTDASAVLNETIFGSYGADIDKITDYPELFTIYYILHNNYNEYYHDYSTLMYFDRGSATPINHSLVTARYRDMSSVIEDSCPIIERDIEPTPEIVIENGVKYERFKTDLFNDAEHEKMLSDMIVVQRKAAETDIVRKPKTNDSGNTNDTVHPISARQFLGDEVNGKNDFIKNMWIVYPLKDGFMMYFDAETLEPLTFKDFVVGDSTAYFSYDDHSKGTFSEDLIFSGTGYGIADDNTVVFSIHTLSKDGEYVFGELRVPLSDVNPKYIKSAVYEGGR